MIFTSYISACHAEPTGDVWMFMLLSCCQAPGGSQCHSKYHTTSQDVAMHRLGTNVLFSFLVLIPWSGSTWTWSSPNRCSGLSWAYPVAKVQMSPQGDSKAQNSLGGFCTSLLEQLNGCTRSYTRLGYVFVSRSKHGVDGCERDGKVPTLVYKPKPIHLEASG